MIWSQSSAQQTASCSSGIDTVSRYRKMIQNLVWATAYNLVAIPVAAGLFVRWGLDLPMSVGAVAMSLSTIIVAANAQLLRRLNVQRESL
jgi:Cu2+-exporting ATPase